MSNPRQGFTACHLQLNRIAMNHLPVLRLCLTSLAAAVLAACSGSGGGGGSESTVAHTTALVTGKAVDGPLQGATACYDLDDNGVCSSSEPTSAATAADGSFAIAVPLAEAGRHRVVVEVPATAIDADTHAAVGSAFVMRAPASGSGSDHSVFVSPLTTLVQAHMDNTGATRDAAAELIRTQAGLTISPLADFSAGSDAAMRQAALVARLVQLTLLQQSSDLAGVVGTPDRAGTLMTHADVQREILRYMVASLPAVAGAAGDPALVGASGTALQETLRVLARALVAQLGLSADALRASATAVALAEPVPADPPVATGQLRMFSYTDLDNWSYRALLSSAADATPDGQGYLRYYDFRAQSSGTSLSTNGIQRSWAGSNTLARAGDLHWNGSQWVGCALTDRFQSRVRDAEGRGDYRYCNDLDQGSSIRRVIDVSGQSMRDVVTTKMRTFWGNSWGPSDLNLYGGATFPPGSYLIYQTNTVTSTAITYDVQAGALAAVFNAGVSAGGDAVNTPSLACNDPLQYSNAATTTATTLETVIDRNKGTPCIYAQSGSTGNLSFSPNEWWGNSTVSIGDLPGLNTIPTINGAYYTTAANVRVAFATSGNGARFYRCYRRASDSSPRNCSLLGLGTWSIHTLGDARVLTFNVMPALAASLGYARVLVERGGSVHLGFKSTAGVSSTDARLNLTAANALMLQLNLPPLQPVTQPGTATGARAAALATLKGAWGGSDGNGALVFRFGDNGRFFVAGAAPVDPGRRELSGVELGWFDFDPVTRRPSTLLELDTSLTSGTSHPDGTESPLTISATRIVSDDGATDLPRLGNNDTTLVGMWAIGSATDLSTWHVVFFADGRAMFIDPQGGTDANCTPGGECPPGVEYASYSYDVQTQTLRFFALQYDTNGCAGLFATCPSESPNTQSLFQWVLAPGGQTATMTDPQSSEVFQMFRIRPQ